MKKQLVILLVLVLSSIFLTGCQSQPQSEITSVPETATAGNKVPERPGNRSTALDSEDSVASAQANAQDSLSENLEKPAFTGGITLYADSFTAFVNSAPVELPAAAFVENGIFYIPLQFVSETMGWSYQKQDDIVILHSGDFETKLTIGDRSICVDGEQASIQCDDWQFSKADVDCDPYVPLVRGNTVFVPYDFLSTQTDRDILSKLSFRTQWFPEEGYAIISGHGKEDGLAGFYVWDFYDGLPEAQRAGMEELGVVGFSREVYDVVEYGTDKLFVHVLRLRDGCEDMDQLDGVISAVYTTDPGIPTPRGLCVGENISRIYTTYDPAFYMSLLCITEGDAITQIRFTCYYDVDDHICAQPTCLHMDAEVAAGNEGAEVQYGSFAEDADATLR